jgi:hypothetical protein
MKNKFELTTPILFLIFNRLEETKIVFEEIKKAQPKQLFIASDGPRENKEHEKKIVEQVRNYIIDNIDWKCKVKTLFRENNLGCKYAVSGAITWFFENVEQGIILEDDCLPSQSFFRFCQEMLEKYKDDKRIVHISGTNVNSITRIKESYFFAYNYNVWGWASWRRAWKNYDLKIKLWPKIRNSELLNTFTISTYERWLTRRTLDRAFNGEINTWDYQWWFSCIVNGGLAIIPRENMIKNIGLIRGTHMNPSDKKKSLPLHEIQFPIVHNPIILNRKEYQRECYKFFTQGRIKRKLRKLVGFYD